MCYSVEGTAKVVLFWNATLIDEGQFRPSEEVGTLHWTTVPQALDKLDYEGEREILSKENARRNT